MFIDGKHFRTIWWETGSWTASVIDQRLLPHKFEIRRLATAADAAKAISSMVVRGAPLIGVTAAYGVALAMVEDPSNEGLARACSLIGGARPTAVNLAWAVERMRRALIPLEPPKRVAAARSAASAMAEADVAACVSIGRIGEGILRKRLAEIGGDRLNVLTHCNAGWLAAVDWGTALAPVYAAHRAGLPVHVWVDETRPRNQGASLTAWELLKEGVPHTLIPDNTGGHLMQHGLVDLCIVGSDRTTARGDVCNKIGTYLKALSARDNDVPFYVALPTSTIDWSLKDGLREIPIEERDDGEVTHMRGALANGEIASVRVAPEGCRVANFGFDVTPARLISGLITEYGAFRATPAALRPLRQQLGAAA